MESTENQTPVKLEIEQLTGTSYTLEVLRGVGVASGLAFLWALELARNACFRMADALSIKPRRKRRVSAFPPGRPRKRQAV